MNKLLALIFIIVSLVNLSLFVYVIFQVYKLRKIGKAYNRFFILLIVGLVWVIDSFLFDLSFISIQLEVFLAYINYFSAALVAGFMASYAIHFPKENSSFTLKKEILFFVPICFVAVLSLIPFAVFEVF